jgi:predicted Abi (CAAX) family protease
VNYIEKSPRRINYATQLTSQTATSKMSDLSIVRMVLAIRRISEEVADDFRMEYIDASTMGDLQRQVYDNIAIYVTNGGCESISVSVSATSYDKTQKRCRVAISLVPTSIMERILIDISVNK